MHDEEAQWQLRQRGLRVTKPRLAILAVAKEHPHADVDTLVGEARRELGSLSKQAGYDVVHALTTAGLLRRIQPSGSPARFETRTGDNHHHVVCRGCGAIADVDCATGRAACLTASNDAGFVIDEAEVTYWGTCPTCLKQA